MRALAHILRNRSSRCLGLVLGKVPQFVLERLDFSLTCHQQMSMVGTQCSIVLFHTLGVMFRFHAFQLEPAPVDDFVCEDGDEDGLEHWATAILVEVALAIC